MLLVRKSRQIATQFTLSQHLNLDIVAAECQSYHCVRLFLLHCLCTVSVRPLLSAPREDTP